MIAVGIAAESPAEAAPELSIEKFSSRSARVCRASTMPPDESANGLRYRAHDRAPASRLTNPEIIRARIRPRANAETGPPNSEAAPAEAEAEAAQ